MQKQTHATNVKRIFQTYSIFTHNFCVMIRITVQIDVLNIDVMVSNQCETEKSVDANGSIE